MNGCYKMYIPDPYELMEMRMDRLIEAWDRAQKGVPAGSFRCPYCEQIFVGEPISANGNPDSPAMCYNCLPNDVKLAYDQFF